MKRNAMWILAPVIGLLAATAGIAQERLGHYPGESVFRFSAGAFTPDGDSSYWDDKERDFFTEAGDYEDFTFSVDFIQYVSARFGVLVSVGGWEGSANQSYRDFVDEFGNEIVHLTTVDSLWLDVGMVFHLLGERAAVMPYLGAGGSFVTWELSEEGEFIDFGVDPPEVIRDLFVASGDGFGYFLLAGLEVPFGSSVTFFAEGRWRSAEEDLGEDFAGFGSLDLSGRSVSAGLSFSF